MQKVAAFNSGIGSSMLGENQIYIYTPYIYMIFEKNDTFLPSSGAIENWLVGAGLSTRSAPRLQAVK